MSLRDAFCIDFEVKMLSKRGSWEVSFSEPLISWFLKDVPNKMLGFEAGCDPKIDAKMNTKSMSLEVEDKIEKMIQNVSQKGSWKLPKLRQNRYKKRIKNRDLFLRPHRSPLAPPDPKTLQNARDICQFVQKT